MALRTLLHALVLSFFAATLLLAACGDDDPATDPTAAARSEATSKPVTATATPSGAGNAGAGAFSSPFGSNDEGAQIVGPSGLALPPPDLERHAVPLDQVFFDTFGGGLVPLDEAIEDLMDRLRDAIVPLFFPDYDGVEGGDWLGPADLILGYIGESGQAYAYPHKILNFHEIVNDDIDGRQVLVSFCPLCRSGVVFDRQLGEETLIFGNTSALYESDLVMFDWQTNSYWWQVPGRAIVGTLAGGELEALPAQTMSWARWRELYPDTLILSNATGYPINHERDPFATLPSRLNDLRAPFPTTQLGRDDRLSPATRVIGVEVGGQRRVYAVELLGDLVLNDRVGVRSIAVFADAEGNGGVAFIAEAAGCELTFERDAEGIRDLETGSRWGLDGRAFEGELTGTRLELPPTRSTFWFSYIGAFPEAELFVP